jgi:hypothetical protein
VKVRPPDAADTSVRWERKAAFDVVARHYAALARQPGAAGGR